MKFSVLMSVYIKENPQFLAESLASLQQQTLPADEILLVCDGKLNDELEQVIVQFTDILPIKLHRLPYNVGLGKALNEGLKYCQNEWVFRMDTDDICLPDRFAKQVAYIKQYPDTLILGGQIAEFNQNVEDIVAYRNVPTSAQQITQFAKKRCPFNHMTVAYQKSMVLACGGYEDLQEDYYLWLKLIALNKNMANLPDILVYARVGNGMVSRRRGVNQAKAEWRLFQLKRSLNIQTTLPGLFTFTLRFGARLLPTTLLQKIYQTFLRK